MDEKDSRQRTKLPVWRTLGVAYATVFGRPGGLFALAAVPLAISIAGGAFILFDPIGAMAGVAVNFGPGAAEGLRFSIGFLTTYLPWAVFVVAWHRFVLLGTRDTRRPVEFYFGARAQNIYRNELFVFLLVVGTFIAAAAIVLLVMEFKSDYHARRPAFNLGLGNLAIAVIVSSRLSFQNPASAIGCKSNIPTAWRQSRGVGWRQFWILVLAPLPFVLLDAQVGLPEPATAAGLASRGFATLGILMAIVAERLVLFLGTAAIFAAVCHSYLRVVDARDRGKEAPTSASEWVTGFVPPFVLGLVLGLATASVAELLGLPAKEQFLLATAAFIIPPSAKVYRSVSADAKELGDTGGS